MENLTNLTKQVAKEFREGNLETLKQRREELSEVLKGDIENCRREHFETLYSILTEKIVNLIDYKRKELYKLLASEDGNEKTEVKLKLIQLSNDKDEILYSNSQGGET